VSIFLANFNFLPSQRFHSTFEVREATDHDRLDDQFQLHIVELPKLPPPGSPAREEAGKLGLWARFFRAVDDAELQELAMNDPIFDKARCELEKLSANPKVRRLAREREEAYVINRMQLHEARKEGKAEAKAQDVLAFLGARGLHVSNAVRERVLACTDLDTLDRWITLAARCSSAEELLADTP
jgi:predicted transposase/invertase (TIGR01784 family)